MLTQKVVGWTQIVTKTSTTVVMVVVLATGLMLGKASGVTEVINEDVRLDGTDETERLDGTEAELSPMELFVGVDGITEGMVATDEETGRLDGTTGPAALVEFNCAAPRLTRPEAARIVGNFMFGRESWSQRKKRMYW